MKLSLQKWLHLGLGALIVLLPWQTRYIINPEANQFTQFSVYGFDLLIFALLCVWLVWWYRETQKPQTYAIFFTLLLLLLLLALQYWSEDRAVSVYVWSRWAEAILVGMMMITTRLPLRWILSSLVIIGLIESSLMLLEFAWQAVPANKWLGMANQFAGELGAPVVSTSDGRWLRAFGSWPHPNSAGGFLVLSIMAGYWLWLHSATHSSWNTLRTWIIAGLAVMAFGVTVSFSRNALIVLCIMSVITLVLQKNVWPPVVVVLVSVVLAIVSLLPLWQSRTSTTQFTEQYSISERTNQLQESVTLLKEHWFVGSGLGTYSLVTELGSPQPVHNIYLLLLVELGVFQAGLLFVSLGYLLYKTGTNPTVKQRLTFTLVLTILALGMLDHYWLTLPSTLILFVSLLMLHKSELQHANKS